MSIGYGVVLEFGDRLREKKSKYELVVCGNLKHQPAALQKKKNELQINVCHCVTSIFKTMFNIKNNKFYKKKLNHSIVWLPSESENSTIISMA